MITSAGIVLAGTFALLAILPLVVLTELGFTIAFGVLLDTLIVRSILVPALTLDIGPAILVAVEARPPSRGPPPVRRQLRAIAKQRNGPIGDIDLVFLAEYTRFESRARVE